MALNQQSGVVETGFYDAFRTNGAPTYYAENHTPWMADILEAGFIFAMCILALSFYFMLPGVHGKERFFTFIWVTSSIFVGGVILLVNYGYEWETSEIHTATKYKAGTGHDINATVGLHIGLRGINITLKGEPENQLNETINYIEHFGWSWSQGRLGFGPFASEFNQEYREAQFRGVPLPVLWIAEYFTFDGEGIRWGRFYKQAGLFANMCLWFAFPCWILANILIFVLLRYGAYFSILTGSSMCTANIIKHYIRNPNELKIPFESVMELKYGLSFWLCLGTGGFCILCGMIVLIMDLTTPWIIAKFFSVSVLQDDELLTPDDCCCCSMKSNRTSKDSDTPGLIGTKDSGRTEVYHHTIHKGHNSAVSRTSVDTATTNSSDLTEIVEVDNDGRVVRKIDVRPRGAPKTGSNVNGKTVGVTGAGKRLDDIYDDDKDGWEDYSSESELEPTDDEEEEVKPAKTPKTRKTTQTRPVSRGFISRFQVRRRQPTATTRRKPARNSVSPESGIRQGRKI